MAAKSVAERKQYAQTRKKFPRAECPVLVGLTASEADVLSQAAKICDTPRATFIRDSSLYQAEQLIKAKKKASK